MQMGDGSLQNRVKSTGVEIFPDLFVAWGAGIVPILADVIQGGFESQDGFGSSWQSGLGGVGDKLGDKGWVERGVEEIGPAG